MKNLDSFLIPPSQAARQHGPNDCIVMSSRVRLARNLRGSAFPTWAKKPERVKVLDAVLPAVSAWVPFAVALEFSQCHSTLSACSVAVP